MYMGATCELPGQMLSAGHGDVEAFSPTVRCDSDGCCIMAIGVGSQAQIPLARLLLCPTRFHHTGLSTRDATSRTPIYNNTEYSYRLATPGLTCHVAGVKWMFHIHEAGERGQRRAPEPRTHLFPAQWHLISFLSILEWCLSKIGNWQSCGESILCLDWFLMRAVILGDYLWKWLSYCTLTEMADKVHISICKFHIRFSQPPLNFLGHSRLLIYAQIRKWLHWIRYSGNPRCTHHIPQT